MEKIWSAALRTPQYTTRAEALKQEGAGQSQDSAKRQGSAALKERARGDSSLIEARRSPWNPCTQSVACKGCGKQFKSYDRLASHLTASHQGFNRSEEKFLYQHKSEKQPARNVTLSDLFDLLPAKPQGNQPGARLVATNSIQFRPKPAQSSSAVKKSKAVALQDRRQKSVLEKKRKRHSRVKRTLLQAKAGKQLEAAVQAVRGITLKRERLQAVVAGISAQLETARNLPSHQLRFAERETLELALAQANSKLQELNAELLKFQKEQAAAESKLRAVTVGAPAFLQAVAPPQPSPTITPPATSGSIPEEAASPTPLPQPPHTDMGVQTLTISQTSLPRKAQTLTLEVGLPSTATSDRMRSGQTSTSQLPSGGVTNSNSLLGEPRSSGSNSNLQGNGQQASSRQSPGRPLASAPLSDHLPHLAWQELVASLPMQAPDSSEWRMQQLRQLEMLQHSGLGLVDANDDLFDEDDGTSLGDFVDTLSAWGTKSNTAGRLPLPMNIMNMASQINIVGGLQTAGPSGVAHLPPSRGPNPLFQQPGDALLTGVTGQRRMQDLQQQQQLRRAVTTAAAAQAGSVTADMIRSQLLVELANCSVEQRMLASLQSQMPGGSAGNMDPASGGGFAGQGWGLGAGAAGALPLQSQILLSQSMLGMDHGIDDDSDAAAAFMQQGQDDVLGSWIGNSSASALLAQMSQMGQGRVAALGGGGGSLAGVPGFVRGGAGFTTVAGLCGTTSRVAGPSGMGGMHHAAQLQPPAALGYGSAAGPAMGMQPGYRAGMSWQAAAPSLAARQSGVKVLHVGTRPMASGAGNIIFPVSTSQAPSAPTPTVWARPVTLSSPPLGPPLPLPAQVAVRPSWMQNSTVLAAASAAARHTGGWEVSMTEPGTGVGSSAAVATNMTVAALAKELQARLSMQPAPMVRMPRPVLQQPDQLPPLFQPAAQATTNAAHACSLCGVLCNSAINLQQHLVSRRHLQRQVQAHLAPAADVLAHDGRPGNRGRPGPPVVTYVGSAAAASSYCRQVISADLNAVVVALLARLKAFQERAMAKNAVKAGMRRWYVSGLREVRKSVVLRKAHAVVMAPNIEESGGDDGGGLDAHVASILSACAEAGVPVAFALSRKKLGEVYGCRKRMSAIAILDPSGVGDLFDRMLEMAEVGRQQWEAAHAQGGDAPVSALDKSAGTGPSATAGVPIMSPSSGDDGDGESAGPGSSGGECAELGGHGGGLSRVNAGAFSPAVGGAQRAVVRQSAAAKAAAGSGACELVGRARPAWPGQSLMCGEVSREESAAPSIAVTRGPAQAGSTALWPHAGVFVPSSRQLDGGRQF